MSRKKCNRTHYATTGFDAVGHAISGARVVDQKSLDMLTMRDLTSLEAVMNGKGGVQEWWDLTGSLNICETMARNGIGKEALDDCAIAQTELKNAAKRFDRSKVMGFTGIGITAIRNMLEYHQLQRQSISRSDYSKYIKMTLDRYTSKAPELDFV
jgi:hypothetical protein